MSRKRNLAYDDVGRKVMQCPNKNFFSEKQESSGNNRGRSNKSFLPEEEKDSGRCER